MELSRFFRPNADQKIRERDEFLSEMLELAQNGASLNEIEKLIEGRLNPDNPSELPLVSMQEGKPYCLS